MAADDAIALGVAGLGLVFARDLYRQFAGFGAGIAEEDGIGKGIFDKTLRQPLLPRNAKQVGGMPQLLCLLGKSGDDMRVAMTEAGHRNAAGKIEKLATVGSVEIRALAPFDFDVPPGISRHNGWYHEISPA